MKTNDYRRYLLLAAATFNALSTVTILSAQSQQNSLSLTNAQTVPDKSKSNNGGKQQNEMNGVNNFDFLVGEWRVHHRRLKPGSNEWLESDGRCSNRPLMDGAANLEEHALNAPNGAYRAVALRSYDSKTGQWAIWWLDGRYPSGPLDPPVKGRFENSVGTFYGDDTFNGEPIRVRFLWTRVTSNAPRWEQAFSSDGGKNWETNWIMDFTPLK